MNTQDFTLPPYVVHLATYEAFAVFRDLHTLQSFCVPLGQMTTEGIRIAWLESRSEFTEENPDIARRFDAAPVLCFVAICALLAASAIIGWGIHKTLPLFFK